MECFSIDESGYTGFDLLNPAQRFQGACALCIAPDTARSLILRHFPRLQASELKYSALARRSNNRARLLALQKDVLSKHLCVTMVCDKRFLLILKFLDFATEPAYYEADLDFYQDGQNFALASALYYAGPALLGAIPFDATLHAFQHAVREKTPESLRALVEAARQMDWRQFPEAFGPIVHAAPACLSAIATKGVTTDAAFVVLQGVISRLEVMAAGPYRVEHDRSDNLRSYQQELQRLISHTNSIEFKQTKITSLRFPLKLASADQVDSKDSPAVQLADVMVGAAMEAANTLGQPSEHTNLVQEVFGQYADEQLIHILPSLDFEAEKRFRQGSQATEFIDYFATHFAS